LRPAEFVFARDLLIPQARQRALRLRNEHARRIIEREIEQVATRFISAYVVSFSEQGNLLSQWRAYASRDGVSIGFHRGALEAVKNFALRRCHYLQESATPNVAQGRLKWVTAELDQAIGWTSRLVQQEDRKSPARGRKNVDSIRNAAIVVSQELVWMALRIKHSGFSEEREWRLIDNRDPRELYELRQAGTDDRMFRRGAFGLTPYLIATLPESWRAVPLGIAEVIVGPGPNAGAVVESIKELLESKLRSTARVVSCGIPYRAW